MRRTAALLTASALLAAGCGNDETPAPDVTTPGPRLGSTPVDFPEHGLALEAPAGWNVNRGQPPLIATIATGQATIAVWRYPRAEELPASKAELDAARTSLVQAASERDPTFKVIKDANTEVDDRPAVQIRARETIEDQPRVVRSTHVYAEGGEIVVDAFAAPGDFRRVDAEVFRPLLRTLTVSKPRGG
jgi:hypothetical protein